MTMTIRSAWTTSYTRDPMDLQIVEDARHLINQVINIEFIPVCHKTKS